ncbi:hypothetical protein F4775DRAFT_600668 [Biscogniauxia sp. FL1348]|nr:hypothetical protein F4775DRAFT_600668 [Biscogniauxia sp. FL1348]
MCNCERITYRCTCRHKERKIQRCWSYQLKKSNLCLAAVMPVCKTHKRHVKLNRLCGACDEYFSTRYGDKNVVRSVVARFLAYKEAKGWGKKTIDPHTVPREVYITAADLDGLRQMYPHQPQPRTARHPGSPLQAGVGVGVGPQRALPAQVRAPPQVYRPQLREKAIPPSGQVMRGGRSPAHHAPAAAVVEYGTGSAIELDDLVADSPSDAALPELRHLAADRYREPPTPASATSLQHPKPRVSLRSRVSGERPDRAATTSASSASSDISVVRHLTSQARTWTWFPNPESPQYPEVPQIASAPRTPSWRAVQLLEEKQRQKREHKKQCKGKSPVPGSAKSSSSSSSTGTRSSSTTTTYHVLASPSSPSGPSLARVLSPSHTHVVVPPPQRLEGVLVHAPFSSPSTTNPRPRPPYTAPGDSNMRFFREHGVAPSPSPSPSSTRLECRSAPPALQVSVHVPSPNFSCAVQAQCFCGKGDENGKGKREKCPACAERERLQRQFKMDWI